MKVIVIGNGEVGSALIKLLSEKNQVEYTDLEYKAEGQFDIMCVAIPYSNDFVDTIKYYQYIYKPKSTIIFSSVAIGTSRILNAVHSPIEGIHPYLYDSLKLFTRFIGGEDALATEFLKDNFYKVSVFPQPEYTEIYKLCSTTLYGLNIEMMRYVNDVCKINGLSFDGFNTYNKAYNELYKNLGFPEYSRYLLYPPEGKIGGHCVRENKDILNKQFPDKILDIII